MHDPTRIRIDGARTNFQHGLRRSRPWLLVAAVASMVAACETGSPSGPGSDNEMDPDTDPDTDAALECEARDYPCSLSEVSIDVLERSDELGDEVLAMWEGGASTAETAAWLGEQADMAEVEWDDLAVRFRLEGGRGTWILREDAFGTTNVSDAVPPAVYQVAESAGNASHIVAPDVKEKKALVLAPFLWEFGEYDEGAAIAGILAGTRGYEGRVSFLANAEKVSSNVTIGSFMGWNGYQVIHVTTHGKRLCTDGGCRATILAGTLEGALPGGSGSTAEKLHELAHLGVEHSKSKKYPDVEYLVLTADFFRHQYPGGVAEALIVISACQTFGAQATDLIDAIHGAGSVVFGWDEAVYAEDAGAASLALYESLSALGYPAKVAYDEMGALTVGGSNAGGPASARFRMRERSGGGDLRIREVVYLLHPGTAEVLAADARVSIQGAQGDGELDAVPYLVRIDGVKPDFAADMTVHVSVDGVEAEPVSLASGEVNDKHQWTISGVIPLPYDLEEEMLVNFQASTNLHSGGESEHETPATLTGEEPIMGSVWELEATFVADWTTTPFPATPYTATANLTLTFEEGQDPQEPHPRYIVTGGTVTWNYNHTYGDCTFSAPPITFEVTPERAHDSHLTFDTTVGPVLYGGYLFTRGPAFEYEAKCDENTFTNTRAPTNVWFVLDPGEYLAVSADRRTITGTYRTVTPFPDLGYDFVQESNYTATRIK